MGRAPCCDKANVKKGPWSPEEDAKLKSFIETNGTGGNWITLPSKAGLKRCGKSCRLRWINYLRPDIKHGSFTEAEERIIYQLHASIGSRWSLIAAQLPGRTDNDIKNYWNTRLKKKLAERGMNTHHNQRGYHMQNMTSQFSGFTNELSDGFLQQMVQQPQVMHYYQQEHQPQMQYNATPQVSQPVTLPAFPRLQHLQPQQHPLRQQQQMLPIKNEMVNTRTVSNAGIGERLMMIESSLRSCIPTPVVSNSMGTSGSPVSVHQSSTAMSPPVAVEQSRHQSPSSSCSGVSSDRSYGGQLADSAYSSNFNNSIEDSTCLGDSQASLLMPGGNVTSQQPQQLRDLKPGQKDHCVSVNTPERFGLEEVLQQLEPYQSSACFPDPAGDRQVVKEEFNTESPWWSHLLSPMTPRPPMGNKLMLASPRCGAENVFSVPTQSPTTQALEVFGDQFNMFKTNYVGAI